MQPYISITCQLSTQISKYINCRLLKNFTLSNKIHTAKHLQPNNTQTNNPVVNTADKPYW